ncbi:DUF975 family protein [Domibacillus epiphyticus]|uniref:DUF975 domain-containing protein n=1 Tax=Domibacillus epiphyticus TaxID=1714355 RepID=A0A1V2A705_9BACI|nr:DUF975 family protein [Domibacillus epiphyticus]OMP66652.1 hypothetical protein BTO28_11455 [Domibacillus epiphyticus]
MYSQLRAKARESLKGSWLIAVLLFIVSTVLFLLPDYLINFSTNPAEFTTRDIISMLISLLLIPITIGLTWAWIDLSRGKRIGFCHLFEPYQKIFIKSIVASFLQCFFVLLWSLLLLVPGIIKSFSYMMTFYILRDRPELSSLQAITESRKLMDGHKGEAFVLCLTFIGWFLLCIITFGIALLWVAPYISVTFAHFYNTVQAEYEAKQRL